MHEATSSRRRISIRGMLASVGAIAAGTMVAVLAAGGSYALLEDDATLTGGTISSGSLGLAVSGNLVLGSNLVPGDVVSQEIELTNSGTVAATVAATTTGAFGELEVRTQAGTCGGAIAGASSTTTPTALGVFGPTGSGTAAQTVCVQVTLPTGATGQGAVFDFTMTFTADQVP